MLRSDSNRRCTERLPVTTISYSSTAASSAAGCEAGAGAGGAGATTVGAELGCRRTGADAGAGPDEGCEAGAARGGSGYPCAGASALPRSNAQPTTRACLPVGMAVIKLTRRPRGPQELRLTRPSRVVPPPAG